MSHNQTFFIGAYWKEHKVSCQEYILLLYEFLKVFSEKFEIFRTPELVDDSGNCFPLSLEKDTFIKSVFPSLAQEDTWYYTVDSRSEKITLDAFSDAGFYTTIAFSDKPDLILSLNAGHHKVTSLTGDVYGGSIPNSFTITFPTEDFDEIEIMDKAALFKEVMRFFNPNYGYIISKEFRRKIVSDNNTTIGWINFLRDKIPSNEVEGFNVEVVENGILIYLSTNHPSLDDKELIEKAIKLRELLKEKIRLVW